MILSVLDLGMTGLVGLQDFAGLGSVFVEEVVYVVGEAVNALPLDQRRDGCSRG